MGDYAIPFNKPFLTGRELTYIAKAHEGSKLAGDGPYTGYCHTWLQRNTACHKALLTHSCTAALEMSAMLLDIQPGDEVIMPSFTFVSTANAYVLRGAVPVFVDIRGDTLNIDEQLIEAAITPRTRVILPVHYAGVGCEMDSIGDLARQRGLKVVEDAAQGIMATYKGRRLGSIGDFGCFSFHETKNLISGEGGALLINDPEMAARAELIREKGTDRSRFFRGEVDKYTWQEMGSSYLPGELIAAFLWAQLESAEEITRARREAWQYYHQGIAYLERGGLLKRPQMLDHCEHNAHTYYVILDESFDRLEIIERLDVSGVNAIPHYVPLHDSPGGLRFGRVSGSMHQTESLAGRLIRLPLWIGIASEQQDRVISALHHALFR